jgi:hypothetical protein
MKDLGFGIWNLEFRIANFVDYRLEKRPGAACTEPKTKFEIRNPNSK